MYWRKKVYYKSPGKVNCIPTKPTSELSIKHWHPFLDNIIFEYSTAEEITKHIQNLKPKSSSGFDQISSKVLKDIGPIIIRHFCLIVNQSLCTGIFPDRLK